MSEKIGFSNNEKPEIFVEDSNKYTIKSFFHLVSSHAIIFYGLFTGFFRIDFISGWR